MGKKILSDVVVSKRALAAKIFQPPAPSILSQNSVFWSKRKKIIFIILVFVAAIMMWQTFSARMIVYIIPKNSAARIEKEILLGILKQDNAPVHTISINDSKTNLFNGTVTEASVERKAKGTVVLFNKSSQSPQALVATTRLETPDGKIFRIPRYVAIPGYRTEAGEIIPGSKEVEVIADKAGDEYNIGLSDFTLLGFLGSTKYKTVFARSKTPMAGGFRGIEKTVSAEDRTRALAELKAEGEAYAARLLKAAAPPESFLIDSSVEYIINDEEIDFPENAQFGTFRMRLNAESRGLIVNKDFIVQGLPNPFGTEFYIKNPENLSYTLGGYSYEDALGVLKISGDAVLEARIDKDKARSIIADTKISSPEKLKGKIDGAENIQASFKPFWLRRVPDKAESIDIIIGSR